MYTVRDLMSNRVLYVTPSATVQAAMELLRLQQLGLLPVVEDGQVVGLLDGITLYRYCGELPVREAMLPPLTVEAETPVGEAASLMGQHRMRHLVVTEEGRLAGTAHRAGLAGNLGRQRRSDHRAPMARSASALGCGQPGGRSRDRRAVHRSEPVWAAEQAASAT